MAFTRKFLLAMGIEPDKVEELIAQHVEPIEALKAERDAYKADADKLVNVQRELDEIKAHGGDKDAYKVKYDALSAEFEAFKASVTEKESKSAKENLYRALLKATGIDDKRIESVLRVSDLASVEVVDGKIKDADKIAESIKSEWADFIVTTGTDGAKTSTPPESGGNGGIDYSKMSDDEYYRTIAKEKK